MGQAGIRCAVAGVGFLLLVSSIAKGFDVEETRATLRGLEGVCVVVDLTVGDKTDTGLQAAGLTANQLQTDVELRLRKAGIRVFTQQEALSMPGRPWLHVVVSVVKNQHFEFYASNITMEVRQNVYLTRAPDIIIRV